MKILALCNIQKHQILSVSLFSFNPGTYLHSSSLGEYANLFWSIGDRLIAALLSGSSKLTLEFRVHGVVVIVVVIHMCAYIGVCTHGYDSGCDTTCVHTPMIPLLNELIRRRRRYRRDLSRRDLSFNGKG